MSNVTNLRQSGNKIKCLGVLAEKDIHVGKDSNGKATLEGYISVKVDEINQIRFNIRVTSTKNDGTSNVAYESISKFNEDAKSIAEVGAENASRVEIRSGQLNPYHSSQSGKDVLGYRTSFAGIYRGSEDEWEPQANADIELFVKSIVPEVNKDGEETGRAIINGVMGTYNGAELLKIVVPNDEGMADAVLGGEIEVGGTYEFFVDIKNSRVEIIKEIPTRLGKPRIEKSYDYTNELIMTGVSEPIEGAKAFDSDAVKLALQEREERIKNAGKTNNTTQNQRPSGNASGRTANW